MISCRLAFYAQTACIQLSVIQFFSVNRSKISKLTLFTKFITVVFTFCLFNNFNKPALKNRYKMKKINKLYEKSVRSLWYFVVYCVNDKKMCLFFTNNTIYYDYSLKQFFFEKLCNNCSWLIVEKIWQHHDFVIFCVLNCMNLFDKKLQRNFHQSV